MHKIIITLQLAFILVTGWSQSPLFIPPLLEGPVFDLQVQNGTTEFFPGITTPTYGVNGNILAPTLVFNKGETVTLNVTNNLNNTTTTMHWHGLHVASMFDGGPHQTIEEGMTWSPQFEVMNNAGTFWYHPHGENKTDFQVSRGLAGMIIIRDDEEAALDLPRTYGVDDFPIIVQTKSFDVLNQIQIATHSDTTLMVNATVNAMIDVPAQVVRLRLLNGASDRSFLFGFSNNMNFFQIATDGGLIETPFETNRLRLSNGERAEVLADFSIMQGETVYLMCYGSELPDGIIGAETVGMGMAELEGYDENPLNGSDYQILQLNIVETTANPVTTIPENLTEIIPIGLNEINVERTLLLQPLEMGAMNMIEGPFGINGVQFNMEVVNETVLLNDVELWTLTNQTQVAHPFHIHDVQFQVVDFNGDTPTPDQSGWKDVVLVMPNSSVSFITRFENFADPITPYMYHCHLLHHEDEGMMGSFVVIDPDNLNELNGENTVDVFPNPASTQLTLQFNQQIPTNTSVRVFDSTGREVFVPFHIRHSQIICDIGKLPCGLYFICSNENNKTHFIKQ